MRKKIEQDFHTQFQKEKKRVAKVQKKQAKANKIFATQLWSIDEPHVQQSLKQPYVVWPYREKKAITEEEKWNEVGQTVLQLYNAKPRAKQPRGPFMDMIIRKKARGHEMGYK